MANIDFEGLEPIEIPHEFVIELNSLIVVNHRLTLEAIDSDEEKELEKLAHDFAEDDPDVVHSLENDYQRFYGDLRRAANNLAAVALVTRLQHWVNRFVRRTTGKPKTAPSWLVSRLNHLNELLGPGPVPVDFFAALEDVRDSVIHNDSNAEWEHQGKPRRVANCYANDFGVVIVSDEQLQDAIAKETQQVEWYDIELYKQMKR